jgi:hypothetical protein
MVLNAVFGAAETWCPSALPGSMTTSMTICQSRSFAKPDHFQVDEFESMPTLEALPVRGHANGVAMDIKCSRVQCWFNARC